MLFVGIDRIDIHCWEIEEQPTYCIGCYHENTTAFNGTLSDVEVLDYAMTTEEINIRYNQKNNGINYNGTSDNIDITSPSEVGSEEWWYERGWCVSSYHGWGGITYVWCG